MDGKKLRALFGESDNKKTQIDLAKTFDVSTRSISNWVKDGNKKVFKSYEVEIIRNFFLEITLSDTIKELTQTIFKIVPSELICIWLVNSYKNSVVLLPNTSYNYFFGFPICEKKEKLMTDQFMTVEPLRTGRSILLSGEAVCTYPLKRGQGRSSSLLKGGECNSLMKIPIMRASSEGPIPIACISQENKLREIEEGKYEVIVSEGSNEIYTADDEKKVFEYFNSFKEGVPDELFNKLVLLETFRNAENCIYKEKIPDSKQQ